MMMKIVKISLVVIFSLLSQWSATAENLFYVLRSTPDSRSFGEFAEQFQNVRQHHKMIDVIVSQAYQMDEQGKVWGSVSPALLTFAHQHQIRVLAMVTNVGFDQPKIHQLLLHPAAQHRAIQALLAACRMYHLAGIQFDLENINVADQKLLTAFYQHAATALHREHRLFSATFVPRLENDLHDSSDYFAKRYENWSGVYDYTKIGRMADFVTLMTYDQHYMDTPPGPVASVNWDESAVRYALHFIPSHKISLGIPTYSDYWLQTHKAMDTIKFNRAFAQLDYATIQRIFSHFRPWLAWDRQDACYAATFRCQRGQATLYIEDVKSFAAKRALAQRYHLRGISVWRLGMEDPRIWNVLAT